MSISTGTSGIYGQVQRLPFNGNFIRMERFGQASPKTMAVRHCDICNAGRLTAETLDFASSRYQDSMNSDNLAATNFHLLNKDLTECFRGISIADVGCGAGSFLYLVKGLGSC